MGRDEVLQHRQTFLKVRKDRVLDDLTAFGTGFLRLGHQTTHTGKLTDLLLRTTGTGIQHHVNRVEALVVGRNGLHQDVGQFGVDVCPDINYLIVTFVVGNDTHIIVVDDLFHFIVTFLYERFLLFGDDDITQVEGQTALEGHVVTQVLNAVQEIGSLGHTAHLDDVADDVAQRFLRNDGIDVPLAIMTYANVVFSNGTDAFLKKMEDAGFSALTLPDVPYEEKKEFSVPARAHGIDLISLIAPTSEDRIRKIAKDATGFIYCVSSLGVTGMRKSFSGNLEEMIKAVRSVNPDIPVAIGFGISDCESARKMAMISDGVIIGSAIVNIVAEYGENSVEPVRNFVRKIIRAIR